MLTTCKVQQQLQKQFGLVDADFAYHESDMYVVHSELVLQWLRKHYPWLRISAFMSPEGTDWNGAGRVCLDVTFAAMDELVEERRPRVSSAL